MADLEIPPCSATGHWHFTYITTDPVDGRWYGGKRATKRHPLADRYLGSGDWIKAHPDRKRLRRTILAFYADEAAVFCAEGEWITWDMLLNDPLCMNSRPGGAGNSVELFANPEFRAVWDASIVKRSAGVKWRKNHAAGIAKRDANLNWKSNVAASNKRLATDPAWIEANAGGLKSRNENPDYLARNAARLRVLHADPVFRVAHLAGIARRDLDPKWIASHAAAGRRLSCPEHGAKIKAGKLRKRREREATEALLTK